MPLFDSDAERLRKQNLKLLEDERLRFARDLEARNFRPERMLFCSREDGSFVALARHEGRTALIESPKFGQEGKFSLALLDDVQYEREEVFEKGTGLNGAFGFGTKGARGFNLHIFLDGGLRAVIPVVFGRNSWLEANYKRNPLLKTKRRRGDANVVWDFTPIDSTSLTKIEEILDSYYLADASGRAAGESGRAPEGASPADAFYGKLLDAIQKEGLEGQIRVNFGSVFSARDCLNVVWQGKDDCEVSFSGESGRVELHEAHLTQQQAEELCLGVLRKRKRGAGE